MKQLLLLSIVLAAAGSILAQNTQNIVPQRAVLFPGIFSVDPPLNSTAAPLKGNNVIFRHPLITNNKTTTRSASVTFTPFASSANLNTVLVSQENCLNANQTLNLISFTHRACNSYVTSGVGNSGWVNTSYSTDGGVTWDTTLLVMSIGSVNTDTGCRYPSGAIYNPIGNTNPANAFAIVAGPYTDNTNWAGYYFGSANFSGSNDNEQIYPNADIPTVTFEDMPRIGMTYANTHAFVIGYNQYIASTGSSGTFNGLVLNTGTFNSAKNNFTWQFQDIRTPVAIDPLDTAQYYGTTDMAWSAGGDTGYIVQYGVDSAQYASAGVAGFYPIVFKSVDSGKTWSKLPYFHFETLSNITSLLINANDYPFIDAVNGSKCVVDYNGNLHIITDIESGSSNPDSLDYFAALPAYIFDLSTTDGTNWNATYIDTIASEAGTSTVWAATAEYVSARIQAAITIDRTKVFITWLDSDPNTTGVTTNDYPDIYSKGLDYTDNNITPTVNFTSNTNEAEACYWLYVSPTAFSNSGVYTIPATISGNSSYDGDEPVEHYYVSGIVFTNSDFSLTGVHTIANSKLGITIYPNPGSGNLNVTFKNYTAQASVIVSNILGSTVKEFNNVNTITNNLTLNLSDLVSGIYFVRIVTAQGSEIQKIVINH